MFYLLLYSFIQTGEFDYAEPMCIECLQKQIETLGESSADVAATTNTLACIYDEVGKYEESETLFHKCLDIRLKLFGSNHNHTNDNGVGSPIGKPGVLLVRGNSFNGSQYMTSTTNINENIKILEVYNNLGILYYHQNKLEKSREYLSYCVHRGAELLGREHYLIKLWKMNLDEIYVLKIVESNNKVKLSVSTSAKANFQ